MFGFSPGKKQRVVDEAVGGFNETLESIRLDCSLKKNEAAIKDLFKDVDTLRLRFVENSNDSRMSYCIAYSEGVADKTLISENIIKPLMSQAAATQGRDVIDTLMNKVVQVSGAEKTNEIKSIVEAVSGGDTVLLAEGAKQALILNTKSFDIRAIGEPENERILRGPREGFTESIDTNLSLIRRRVRTHELKMKFYSMGRRTNTKVCVCYMDGLVNKNVLNELYRRLDGVNIDAVLDTNYIIELIEDKRLSPFSATGYTERPDVVIARLLEGRIAVFVDGTPVVMTVPQLFIENFQSSEDYYMNYYYSAFSRMLRILGFFLTISVPGIYIAIVAFHHELMPTQLMINISSERASVPLPAALEAFLLLIVFDILRETGVRMPSNIGQALSIVGALVIGQSAVEARLVAAPMIIVVALTGITNLLVPRMGAAVIVVRFFLLLASTMFGFYGFVLGISAVFIHILNLHSYGIPQITLTGNLKAQQLKDSYIRAPWPNMKTRPQITKTDRRRQSGSGGGQQ